MSQDFRQQDPYRVARKTPSQEDYYESPSSVHSEIYHSRTASESSTSKLATVTESEAIGSDDPYERKKKKKQKQKIQEYEKRANSYLPYSNHYRDPKNTESIHLQDDRNTTRGPVGSILQDNIVMDLINHDSFYSDQMTDFNLKKQNTDSALIPPAKKKKKWWNRSPKKLLFLVFIFIAVIAVIWYFVWPRTPTLQYVDAGLLNNSIANYTTTSMVASWQVNFTVINSDNWIPTKIHNLVVDVVEESTGVVFGSGSSGPLSLRQRSIDQTIAIPIQINFVKDASDETLKTLLNACGTINQDLSSITPKQTLSVQFNILYYIAGIAWHPSAIVSPQTYFQCP